MKDLFYVVEVKDQWYNLCIKDTHYCLSCGSDLSTLMTVVYNCVRKYKTEDRLLGALSMLSDGGRVSTATRNKRQADYDLGKHSVFNSMVSDTVTKALKDNIQDSPCKKAMKRAVGLVRKIPKVLAPEQPEKAVAKKIAPLRVTRTPLA